MLQDQLSDLWIAYEQFPSFPMRKSRPLCQMSTDCSLTNSMDRKLKENQFTVSKAVRSLLCHLQSTAECLITIREITYPLGSMENAKIIAYPML